MDSTDAVELGRQAVMVGLLIGSPVLLVGMAVGLMVGLLQALTQVHEQSVAFVPKLIAMAIALTLLLPWMIAELVTYSQDLIANIPNTL